MPRNVKFCKCVRATPSVFFNRLPGLYRLKSQTAPQLFHTCKDEHHHSYLSRPLLDLTSLAAKRNCMAQTSRHERLRERVRAHMATVTW